jgi:hypothetical protein
MANHRPDSPSLLRFLLARVAEDVLRADAGRGAGLPQHPYVEHFSPPSMMLRAGLDRDVVEACVEAMAGAPGQPPEPALDPADPITDLGSQVLKFMAARYDEHPDYRDEWRPGASA